MRKLLCFILVAFAFLLNPSAHLFALEQRQKDIIDSGSLYFDLETSDACGPGRLSNSNSSIFVLGDSLTVGMRDSGGLGGKLEAQNWNVKAIEAADSATIETSLGSITEQNIKDTGTILIALGTNVGINFDAGVSEMISQIKAISPNSQIKWVNAYTKVNGYDSVNNTLNQRAGELGFTVIDWKGEAIANPGPYTFAADGIHHDVGGYSAKSDFIARSLGLLDGNQAEQSQIPSGDNISIIFNYFVGKGLTDFQAAGIMGNMHHESGYEPMRAQGIFDRTVPASNWQEAIGGGWGLVQWTPASKMIDKVNAAGQDPNNIQVQLEFVWWEMMGEWPAGWAAEPPTPTFTMQSGTHLRSTTTVADATISFETKYERHAGPPQPSRIVEAERILELARTGGIDLTASAGGGSCGSDTSGGGNAALTAVEYAWPTWRGRGFTTPKPEYDVAVKAMQAEGKYVGGNSMPGIDCGGFVTTVMIRSGFEPNYNQAGTGGSSEIQEAWARANWETIGTVQDSSQLQPGDVAFSPGHTFMYVGTQPGFETDLASASLESRAPMAGKESIINDGNGNAVQWYRKR